jgi:arylsulfatase G
MHIVHLCVLDYCVHGAAAPLVSSGLVAWWTLCLHAADATGMVGKWHLGTANGHHPIDRGFDSYVGLPYSNDMGCSSCQAITYWDVNTSSPGLCPACASGPAPVGGKDYSCGRTKEGGGCIDSLALPIFYNKTISQQPVDLTTVSTQYAHAGARFVAAATAAQKPFFLYVANSHVHVPQNHGPKWTGKSTIGPFGDALMEMDWEIGEIIDAVKEAGQTPNTVFLVSGDNGPWECKCNLTGSSGPFIGKWQKTHGGGGSSRKTTLCGRVVLFFGREEQLCDCCSCRAVGKAAIVKWESFIGKAR